MIYLRKMFNIESTVHEKNSVIIYESSSGPLRAMIDEISGVISLDSDSITTAVKVQSNVSQKYLEGIARLPSEDLVIVLDLQNVIEKDDLVQADHMNHSA